MTTILLTVLKTFQMQYKGNRNLKNLSIYFTKPRLQHTKENRPGWKGKHEEQKRNMQVCIHKELITRTGHSWSRRGMAKGQGLANNGDNKDVVGNTGVAHMRLIQYR